MRWHAGRTGASHKLTCRSRVMVPSTPPAFRPKADMAIRPPSRLPMGMRLRAFTMTPVTPTIARG